jgi:hypothetical protein
MNETMIFYPDEASSGTFWLIGLTLFCVAVLVYSFINKHKTLSMIMGLSVLILAGSTVFNWISTQRTSEVIISKNSIETMYGKVSFSEISKVYIEETIEGELLVKPKNRYLVIEKIGKGYPTALPDGVYPIDSIRSVLNERYRAWKK